MEGLAEALAPATETGAQPKIHAHTWRVGSSRPRRSINGNLSIQLTSLLPLPSGSPPVFTLPLKSGSILSWLWQCDARANTQTHSCAHKKSHTHKHTHRRERDPLRSQFSVLLLLPPLLPHRLSLSLSLLHHASLSPPTIHSSPPPTPPPLSLLQTHRHCPGKKEKKKKKQGSSCPSPSADPCTIQSCRANNAAAAAAALKGAREQFSAGNNAAQLSPWKLMTGPAWIGMGGLKGAR